MQEIADDIGWIMLLTTREQKLLAGRSEKQAESRRVKYWITALAVLASLSTSIALADDFKTINGKEYKNAEVSRVEPDGIVLRSKSGISRVYFTELPKDVQERFHYNPAQATAAPRPAQATAALRQREREQIALRAEQDAIRRQTDQRIRQLHTPVATPSTLYETRAVRSYQAGHSGVRVAKGVYIGGTSGRSISTEQWAALDTRRLTITNQRLVFVGGKEDRTIPLKKIVSVNSSLTEILISVEGRQKTIALAVPNPLIARLIIGICSQVNDPSNLSGDKININFRE